MQRFRAEANGACGVYHIVDKERGFAGNVADNVHYFDLVSLGTAFIDDCHRAVKLGSGASRSSDRAYVRRNDYKIVVNEVLKVFA